MKKRIVIIGGGFAGLNFAKSFQIEMSLKLYSLTKSTIIFFRRCYIKWQQVFWKHHQLVILSEKCFPAQTSVFGWENWSKSFRVKTK